MKKGQVLAGMFLVTASLMAGCGNIDGDAESMEYAQMAGLDNVMTASAFLATGESQNDAPEAGVDLESLVQEAAGDEDIEERVAAKTTDIYSKPGDEGAVVGTVEQGNAILVIDVLEDKGWYKIVYKGRVAYILADAVEEKEDWDALTQHPTTSPNPGTTQDPATSSNPGTTQHPTTSPNPGTTQHPTTSPNPGTTQHPTTSPNPGTTQSPTASPNPTPTTSPTSPPPTQAPTGNPTQEPTGEPTQEPTGEPTKEPAPTQEPTGEPTKEPTPTQEPTGEPIQEPAPTQEPTGEPTQEPAPTQEPTGEPTQEPAPTQEPTGESTQESPEEPIENPT